MNLALSFSYTTEEGKKIAIAMQRDYKTRVFVSIMPSSIFILFYFYLFIFSFLAK
jgi:hypothetical protein